MTRRTAPPKEHGTGRWAKKHGARSLQRHLQAGDLDRRYRIARDFHGAQDALAADRGGWASTTAAERMLIEVAAAELVIVRAMFAWAARQPAIVADTAEGPRLLAPLAKGFTAHTAQLTRTLAALGVRPDKVDRMVTLDEYLASRASPTPAVAAAPPTQQSAPQRVTGAIPAVTAEAPAADGEAGAATTGEAPDEAAD